jgi:hypothetical protein
MEIVSSYDDGPQSNGARPLFALHVQLSDSISLIITITSA